MKHNINNLLQHQQDLEDAFRLDCDAEDIRTNKEAKKANKVIKKSRKHIEKYQKSIDIPKDRYGLFDFILDIIIDIFEFMEGD